MKVVNHNQLVDKYIELLHKNMTSLFSQAMENKELSHEQIENNSRLIKIIENIVKNNRIIIRNEKIDEINRIHQLLLKQLENTKEDLEKEILQTRLIKGNINKYNLNSTK
jgi:hypothetical protein